MFKISIYDRSNVLKKELTRARLTLISRPGAGHRDATSTYTRSIVGTCEDYFLFTLKNFNNYTDVFVVAGSNGNRYQWYDVYVGSKATYKQGKKYATIEWVE